MTKGERTRKIVQCLKIKKKWNLVVSKPEGHNLTHETVKKSKLFSVKTE